MTEHHNVTRKGEKVNQPIVTLFKQEQNQPFKINGHYQQLSPLMSLKLHFWNMLLVIILPFGKVLAVDFDGCVISFIILPAISSHLLIIQLVHGFSKPLIKWKQLFERWFLMRKAKSLSALMHGSQTKIHEWGFDFFAIPAMSSECERAFSKASYTISARWSNLSQEIIGGGEVLRLWINAGVVKLSAPVDI